MALNVKCPRCGGTCAMLTGESKRHGCLGVEFAYRSGSTEEEQRANVLEFLYTVKGLLSAASDVVSSY